MKGYIVILENGTFYKVDVLSQMLIDLCEYGSINIVRLSDGLKMVDASTFDPIQTIGEGYDGHEAEHLLTDKVVEQEETQLDKMMRECYGLYKDGVIYDGNLQDYTDMFFKNFCTVDTKTINVKAETHKNSIGKLFEANCIKYGLKDGKNAESKMRSIEDWLNELPEPIRTKALDSVDKESELYESVNGQAGTYYDAIHLRNDADQRTKEGVDYWVNIYEQLEAGTPPSELVDPVHLDKSRMR